MTSDDRNDSFEELLRSTLTDEADRVTPTGDGLARIQQRITARRARFRWMRPAVAVGSAAALTLIGLGAYALVQNNGDDTLNVTPAITPTGEPTTPSAEPIANRKFPSQAIFPFTSPVQEKAWEASYDAGGHQPWKADPVGVATFWLANYLEEHSVDQVVSNDVATDGQSATVTLGRIMKVEQKRTIAVTAVHLQKYGEGWVVVGASDPQGLLSLTSPDPGSMARSPLSVTGPGFGADEAVTVDVRDALSTTSYGHASTDFGNGTPQWNVSVTFSQPTGPDGVLVATEDSAADGGPQRIVAQQAQFGEASGSGPTAPTYFYAVKNDRIAQFHASDGSSVRYLTAQQPGGGVSDPQLVGDSVYYLQGNGTCDNALMSASATSTDQSQTGTIVASPDTGYVIASYAISSDGGDTVFERACDPARSPQARLVSQTGHDRHAIDFDSIPPDLIGDPAYEPGKPRFLDAIVKPGTSSYVARYDVTSDTSPMPSRHACAGLDPNTGAPQALDADASGTLWVALQTGTSMDVVRCGSKPAVAFSIPGNDTPGDVDVSSDGSAVLLTDIDGKVWRWDGSGDATRLSPAETLTNVTW